MSHLSGLISSEHILLDLNISSKEQLFDEVGRLFARTDDLSDTLVSSNLLAREQLASTGLGHGVAVPHGRIVGLKAPVAAFIRLSRPLPFDSPDGNPITMMVILLIPDNVTQKHLEILSEVAELFSDSAMLDKLSTEKKAATVHKMLSSWLPTHSAGKPPSR
ncbi:MAG: PTS sugar transporter subunit IIA [Burkholderiaceae bacterium]|jgi:PTS system nitrogen regulatory IIA component|nr:PTS sugar transporter subunit IIA [Burkholderiaceae bacterium]